MPVQTMQAIAEHSLFKAALPIFCAALIGSIMDICDSHGFRQSSSSSRRIRNTAD